MFGRIFDLGDPSAIRCEGPTEEGTLGIGRF
jgi:hypothetical protein